MNANQDDGRHDEARQATERYFFRLGGDEFVALGIECNSEGTEKFVKRLRAGLSAAGIKASIGYANRHPETGLRVAVREADTRMYAEKRQHRAIGINAA